MRAGLIFFTMMTLIFLCAAGHVNAAQITDQSQLLDLLNRTSASETDFESSESLYSFLQANHFRELYRLLVKAGIDHGSVEVSYNSLFHHIYLSSIHWNNLPWAECYSREEARQAVLSLAKSGSDFILLCSDSLLSDLTDGNALEIFTAQAGIETYSWIVGQYTGILQITEIRRFTVPYAAVSDYAQFASAVAGFKDRGINDFYILFDPDLLQKVLNDEAEKTIMFGSSKISEWKGAYSSSSGTFHFSEVKYTDDPREICLRVEDVADAIRRMGAAGIRDFELVFPYSEVFEKLAAQDFYMLEKIKAEAGVSDADISYSRTNGRIFFNNAEIEVNVVAMSSLQEAVNYTEQQIRAGNQDIHLFCTESLFHALMGDFADPSGRDRERIYDLITNAGISDYELFYSDISHVINIHVNKLFPGTAIILAERSGRQLTLSDREKQARSAAVSIAASVRSADPLLTARRIHDWLCSYVVYYVDETSEEDDNAIGAILNGKANCDGYADAFYLIGTLAGLEIRYQHGYSIEKNVQDSRSEVGHLWNLLRIDGEWRMVDVTWDDEDTGWTYIWFNIGLDLAKRMHFWNEDMSVAIAPFTSREFRSGNEFYIRNEGDIRNAVNEAAGLDLSDFYLLFADTGHPEWFETAKSLVSERCRNWTLSYSWNEKMLLGGFYEIKW